MNNFTVVVIAFKRPESLERLLISLDKVNWCDENIRLYISIDKDNNESESYKNTVKIAENFLWKYGEKIIDCKEKNLGLKEHVLSCGNLTSKYENLIVLEDDILVSPLMYIYAKQVVDYYKDNDNIAGFGLYSFQRNPLNNLPFIPLNEGTDVYFLQYACSWGQIWTKNKWDKFYRWYKKNKDTDFSKLDIPYNVKRWDGKSWLKYHIIYTILENKFFVYPHTGFTTNFSEMGTHNTFNSFAYQCIIHAGNNSSNNFRFINFESAINKYDGYFENVNINKMVKMDKKICSDLYGEKDVRNINKDSYLLSSKRYNYKILKRYALQMYPYEQNIINNINGNDIYLYDLSCESMNKYDNKNYTLVRYLYKIDFVSRKDIKKIIKYFFDNLIKRIKSKGKNKRKNGTNF